MRDLQSLIFRFEQGSGAKSLRSALGLLVFCGLAVLYNFHSYRNFHTEEAMDTAQLAANISEGRGFSTLYVRPFALYLLAGHGPEAAPSSILPQPDLANAPVYPLLLAGLLKVVPVHTDIPSTRRQNFSTYQPEVLITLFNQLIFLVGVAVLFRMARGFFDEPTAWISTTAFAGSEIYWKFSVSGSSTLLLVLVFLGLVWLLAVLDAELRAQHSRPARLIGLAAGLGAVTAAGMLTRYAFGWVLVPLLLFLLIYGGSSRWRMALAVTAGFLVLMTPWFCRNYLLCGHLFGLAGYAPCELTQAFPGDTLVRSSNPASGLHALGVGDYWRKLVGNLHEILQGKLPTLGANWLFMLFLAGFLLPFQSAALSRLRVFLVLIIIVFIPIEALAKTHLSIDFPEVNSDNLLVIFAPFSFVFGASFFCTLLEHGINLAPYLRLPVLSGFAVLNTLPFLAGFLTDASYPVAYPPYYPPAIRTISAWINPDEAVMTDIPWAMAWYGRRRAVGLALDTKEEFERIRLESKGLRMLFLSGNLLKQGFRGLLGSQEGWGRLAVAICVGGRPPQSFPFQSVLADLLPDEVLLGDTPRWETPISGK